MGFRFALLIGFMGLSAAACAPPASSAERAAGARRDLSQISLLALDRRPVRLPELSRGRPALVALWASWCDGCRREFASLNRLHARVGERALVIGVAEGETLERVERLVRDERLAYPQLVDEHFAVSDALGMARLPATLVFGATGELRHSGGALDGAALAALRAELAQSGSP